MERIFRSVLLGAALTSICACANQHSIFRYQKIDPDQPAIVLVDAKQREILVGGKRTTTIAEGKETIDQIQRFCSAPSPDVFSVVAQALSAGGTFSKGADPASIQAALNAAFSSAEQGSTIPRTQTINMLRELMFRTCERYLNDGIGTLELPIQAARDQRLMVSILAIESLTGAVTPKPIVIGAGADASGGASGAEAAVRLDNAYKDLQAKTTAQQSRQNEYNEITTDKKHCEQIAEAVAKKEEDKLPQELKDKRAKCESATGALAAAKKQTADSTSHYATLKDTAASGGIPVAATATVMTPKADGGLDSAHSESISAVALIVKDIVEMNMQQDEFLFLCLKVLSNDPDERQKTSQNLVDGTKDTCIAYIKAGIELEEARKARDARAMSRSRTLPLFDGFWRRMSKDSKTADADAVKAGQAKFGASWPKCFTAGASRDVFDQCFHGKDVTSQDQRDFAAMGEEK